MQLANTIYRYAFIAPVTLTLTRMTLLCELDVNVLKIYLHTKSELSRSSLSKVRALQSHRHGRTHYHAAFVGGNNMA